MTNSVPLEEAVAVTGPFVGPRTPAAAVNTISTTEPAATSPRSQSVLLPADREGDDVSGFDLGGARRQAQRQA
jgi:hypothetical protein